MLKWLAVAFIKCKNKSSREKLTKIVRQESPRKTFCDQFDQIWQNFDILDIFLKFI